MIVKNCKVGDIIMYKNYEYMIIPSHSMNCLPINVVSSNGTLHYIPGEEFVTMLCRQQNRNSFTSVNKYDH
jgi:hypothetical protein